MPMFWGKAHFFAKDEEPSLDPMEYRVLLVLQRLYRRWATMRLRHLQPWVQAWQLEEMYAGVPAAGADVAWVSTALGTEQAMADRVELIPSMLYV